MTASALSSHTSASALRRAIERWLDAIESGWSVPVFLVVFTLTWTAIFSVAYLGADLHMDTLETWSVGRVFAWGFWKHPPLMGWMAKAWMSVFPLTNWSFLLMAMVNAAIALYAVDLIARRFVRGDKRAIILLLLLLTPIYQFHAEKFNANSVLLAVWPLATYCFMRSFEERTVWWSLATGVLCALAMLGKYYSIFLLAGFVFAAFVHPNRKAYLTSQAPWLTLAAGLVAITPHLRWLAADNFEPFHYATLHGGRSLFVSIRSAITFLLNCALYLTVAALVWVAMTSSRWSDYVRAFAPSDPGLLLLTQIFGASLILPAIVVIAIGTDLPATWHPQGLFFVVVLAVCGSQAIVTRETTVRLVLLTLALWTAALAAAPLFALYRNYVPFSLGRNYYHQAADVLTETWHKTYGTPLPRVSGGDGLAFGAAFYGSDHPFYSRQLTYLHDVKQPQKTTLQKTGWGALCFADDVDCINWMIDLKLAAPDAVRWTFQLTTSVFGLKGASTEVVAMMKPPLPADGALLPSKEKMRYRDSDEFSSRKRAGHI